MSLIIKTISSIIITLCVSLGVSGTTEVTPQEAADEFLSGLSTAQDQVMESYMDNRYINFLENVKGSNEDMDRLENALLKNFTYRITDTATRDNIAVCRVEVNNSDFSNILKAYRKASYKYVTDNLYDEKVTDKEQLNRKCLELYIKQLEKAAGKEPSWHREIFLPMEDNGYGGWRIVLSDEIMQAVLGGLEIPEGAETDKKSDKGGND